MHLKWYQHQAVTGLTEDQGHICTLQHGQLWDGKGTDLRRASHKNYCIHTTPASPWVPAITPGWFIPVQPYTQSSITVVCTTNGTKAFSKGS